MQTYFNTTQLQGTELQNRYQSAKTCADFIMRLFHDYPHLELTPERVMNGVNKMYGKNYPITSIRARMTTLTDEGRLEMSKLATAKGSYGANVHTWRLSC